MVCSTFTQIVLEYRHYQKLSLRAFANQINEKSIVHLCHQTISNWEKGICTPVYHSLIPIALLYGDWRRDFAIDALAALHPNLYTPIGDIGKRLLATEGTILAEPEKKVGKALIPNIEEI